MAGVGRAPPLGLPWPGRSAARVQGACATASPHLSIYNPVIVCKLVSPPLLCLPAGHHQRAVGPLLLPRLLPLAAAHRRQPPLRGPRHGSARRRQRPTQQQRQQHAPRVRHLRSYLASGAVEAAAAARRYLLQPSLQSQCFALASRHEIHRPFIHHHAVLKHASINAAHRRAGRQPSGRYLRAFGRLRSFALESRDPQRAPSRYSASDKASAAAHGERKFVCAAQRRRRAVPMMVDSLCA